MLTCFLAGHFSHAIVSQRAFQEVCHVAVEWSDSDGPGRVTVLYLQAPPCRGTRGGPTRPTGPAAAAVGTPLGWLLSRQEEQRLSVLLPGQECHTATEPLRLCSQLRVWFQVRPASTAPPRWNRAAGSSQTEIVSDLIRPALQLLLHDVSPLLMLSIRGLCCSLIGWEEQVLLQGKVWMFYVFFSC